MTSVDARDDSVRRFVVRRYAYDPSRNQRRQIIVAAFDSEREFSQELDLQLRLLSERRDRGEVVDPREHVSGICVEPGEAKRRGAARIAMAAIRRGVVPPDWVLDAAQGAAGFQVLGSRRQSDEPAGP